MAYSKLDRITLDKVWTNYYGNDEANLRRIFKILSQSKKGKSLLEDAKKKSNLRSKTLFDVIKVGSNSITDTTISRKFHPQNALEVIYEVDSVVFINRSLSTYHAVLDLAHELVHFTMRKDFNPYLEDFGVKKFIKNTVEAKGGEAHAFMIECVVSDELFDGIMERESCSKILNKKTHKHDIEIAKSLFYNLGPYYRELVTRLDFENLVDAKKEFSSISKNDVVFFSSAYSLPYPLASILEFQVVKATACKNDEKRLKVIQSSIRSPGSVVKPKLYKNLEKSFYKRCQSFL